MAGPLAPLLAAGRALLSIGGAAKKAARLAGRVGSGIAGRAGKITTGASHFARRHVADTKVGRAAGTVGQFAADHYWTLDNIASKLNSLNDSFSHVITVKCVGGPAADLRRVYYLACAAAFGRYGRATTRVNGSYFKMSCSADITDKSVTITVAYNTSLIGDVLRANDSRGAKTPLDVMFDGPDQVTIGHGWVAPFFTSKGAGSTYARVVPGQEIRGGGVKPAANSNGNTPPGISEAPPFGNAPPPSASLQWIVGQPEILRSLRVPVAVFRPFALQSPAVDALRELPSQGQTSRLFYMRRVVPPTHEPYTVLETRVGGRVPRLPDDGRVITTGETGDFRIQPPRPPVDGIARGSLLALTVQALTNPGYLPELPTLTETPLGTGGVYLWSPGTASPRGNQVGVVREEAPPDIVRPRPVVVQLPILGGVPVILPLPYYKAKDAPLLRDPLR